MIVPDHWAEARIQHRAQGRQVTVRRYGWSMLSEADALRMAQARAQEALQRILAGEALERRERKRAYNGATGGPIREEVLARHGDDVVVTRNAYGARCLNSERVLFADIDFEVQAPARQGLLVFAVLALAAVGVGVSRAAVAGLMVLALLLALPLARAVHRLVLRLRGGPQQLARRRIRDFLARQPAWNLRIYRTPAGLRLLATHQAFDAASDEVQRFFAAVSADPVYVRMCTLQRCFRARLSAKPWRIGVTEHLRPRTGAWPVRPEQQASRAAWIARYEALAAGFAACHYEESLGSGVVDETVRLVIELHDRETRAQAIGVTLA